MRVPSRTVTAANHAAVKNSRSGRMMPSTNAGSVLTIMNALCGQSV
jgi:hypothetical protein